ncbi:MAG: AAA family ATPase [Thermoplasmata archaeon]
MSSLPSPFLRAMQALAERSGRTIVVSGPPLSGKSALLQEMRTLVKERGGRLVELRGSYRARSVPYGALDGLNPEAILAGPGIVAIGGESALGSDGELETTVNVPMAPIAYSPDRLPRSRRSRGERARTSFLGQPMRERSANEGDPEAYWQQLLSEFRGPEPHPVVILIEDGALFDSESREFIVALSKKARLRPLVIVCALDTSVPGYVAWEDAFLGRGDVDWVRIPDPLGDAREAHRLKGIFDDLPSVTQRVVGYVALLRGTVGEVVLSRVARLSYPQLAEALLPATGVGLVKLQEGRVTIPHVPWISLTADLLADKQLREMHLEIANALAALSPEPTLARRIEVARHYLAWFAGPMALKHLLEAGELSLHLHSFDTAEELFAEAITCLPSLPPPERAATEPELRLLHAQALFCSGRLSEAEIELREGIATALRAQVPVESLAEWLEPLVLTMRVIGPRASLSMTLAELADRCHDARWTEIEILLQSLIAEFEWERNHAEKSREESRRAAALAQSLPPGHLQAIALLAVGLARIEGTPDEQEVASQFLRAARLWFGRTRRWELDHMAGDLEARLLEVRGETQKALQQRQHAIPILQRQKLLSVELYHQLAIASTLLDRRAKVGVDVALDRAHLIVESLHLIPPSPALLRLWLLEGRQRALNEETTSARDRWEAIADEPAVSGIPRLRAEALVRLALLEFTSGRPELAEESVRRLDDDDLRGAIPAAWAPGLADLARLASESEHGGAPLPIAAVPLRRDGQSRERARREPVRDRQRADDQEDPHHDPVQ